MNEPLLQNKMVDENVESVIRQAVLTNVGIGITRDYFTKIAEQDSENHFPVPNLEDVDDVMFAKIFENYNIIMNYLTRFNEEVFESFPLPLEESFEDVALELESLDIAELPATVNAPTILKSQYSTLRENEYPIYKDSDVKPLIMQQKDVIIDKIREQSFTLINASTGIFLNMSKLLIYHSKVFL